MISLELVAEGILAAASNCGTYFSESQETDMGVYKQRKAKKYRTAVTFKDGRGLEWT